MNKKKKTSHLPFRLNVVFFIIFLLFALLVLQLGVVQILHGDDAQQRINRTVDVTTKIPVPRGKMYDRNGNLVVDNKALYSITYTPPKRNIQPQEKLAIAEKLSQYITKETDKVTTRDMKDYWILVNKKEAYGRLTSEEQNELDDTEQYYAVLESITDEDLQTITEREMEIIAIKRELDQAPAHTPHIVKNDKVTEKEYAIVAGNLDQLPGINVTTDWDRYHLYDGTFGNFIGRLTSHDEGLLSDNLDFYLARDYSRNDRVGRSGLEKQYETILRGQKEEYLHVTNDGGNVVRSELIHEGEQGKSLVLTVDMELQQRVDQIVREELQDAIEKYPEKNQYLEDALVVMMDPNTGEVLAMSGQHYDREEDEYKDASFKVVYDAHRPGSAVKGATVLAGLESGVIKEGTVFYDRPIKIAGTPQKSSWINLGNVNDLDALRRSSNVYMFFIAMRMGGEYNYARDKRISFNPEAFTQMRNYFQQFGLGVKTGVDLPFESTGYKGPQTTAGLLLDYAIGQYDTFTTLQLAQYVSTIANGGYRLRPQLVKEIRYSDNGDRLGPIYRAMNPEVLNQIEMTEYIERVQEGFYQVFNVERGTAYGHFRDKPYTAAGKTGTAQNEVYRQVEKDGELVWEKVAETENLTLVGYAPYENPEVSFAIVVPNLGQEAGNSINHKIGKRILDTYFELKEKRTTTSN
ncbi:peptidoglycan D,D-transpeptidase FtsI family protein [Salirhabdus salicampi]|uniref:peptidoglycan D,D-transpeptidase FtsI family protein n=1 Tax=Salirhabdus salicampi TaxID=476102 RepID=UPI0020C4850F|nr:penicillin-binding protein 2 [Salirhabdus salicampi]MCP8616873.1 penicillin-binding protein 2 [Salirhabdus salicampi]